MKYKVVSLILIIPIVLMLCVFSAANIASLKVPIPVSSVSLFHDRQEIVNLAEGNEFQIDAQVMPRNASNKGLIYSYEQVNGRPLPNLDIDENGLVKASGYGTAKITVATKDGGYKNSFILEVTSTIATDMQIALNTSNDIVVGDEFVLESVVLPNEALDKSVVYSSSNENVVTINALSGECRAISSGVATLKATLENGLNGKIERELQVAVLPIVTNSLITFDGSANLSDKIFADDYSVIMEVNFSSLHELGKVLTTSDIILEYNKSSVTSVNLNFIEANNGIYKYQLNILGLTGDVFNLKASLDFDNYVGYYSEIYLEKIVDFDELNIHLSNFKNYIKKNATNSFNINVLPNDLTDYQLGLSFENNNISLVESNGVYYIKGTEVGQNTLHIDILIEGEVIKSFTEVIEVLNPPSSINFIENTNNYGIEDLLTIGNKKIINDNYVENRYEFSFTTNIDLDYIEFSSSNENIAKIIDNKLVVLGEGRVTLTATELQSKLLGIDLSTSIEVRCVDGVEVGTYQHLVKATKENKPVVITNDIMLGEKLVEVDDNGIVTLIKKEYQTEQERILECIEILESELNQIETTSEWNYYKNHPDIKAETPPTINYIIKFTNDCYGNGYVLNANNITNLVDSTNQLLPFAKFTGPLNLVAIPGASVKAQDNICFIASDNVLINNVELVGADLRGADTADLNQLNYAGTVLEVMGDNVKIVNSRIRNGRNCIRVYGKEAGNYDRINVLIESCVISNAREFLIKMGTNAKIYGNFENSQNINMANGVSESVWQECSPAIEGLQHLNDGSLTVSQYEALVREYLTSEKYQQLIKTNLTVKNCVLHTSGLFSIGLESSFAGPALDGGKYSSWNFAEHGWLDIAGTSYPTMLNLEGNVKIYDWKNITHIDSSTLVEGGMFNFDLSQMIKSLYNSGSFTDIITELDGEKYCHGGIVMYGGGRNYALVNNNLEGVEAFGNYSVSLDSLNTALTSMLKYASGRESFRMFMYGKSNTFNYYKQVADMESGLAFSDLSKYVF